MCGRKRSPRPIVSTQYGDVLGIRTTNCYKTPYLAFHNIPYAEQPTGDLRFKDPCPLQPWKGVLNATKVGSASYQYEKYTPKIQRLIGSDRCLHLNIYTQDTNPEVPKPVMIYIHGGGFRDGSGSPFAYGPDYLIDENVVLVTINYRLLMFGFLSFKNPDIGISGNAGLKDQVMALRWIKENISAFGGDQNNITLFGESAGSVSVHLHLLSPLSKGLFHRAIMMSGSAFCPWVLAPERGINLRLARAAGYKGADNEQDIYEFITKTSPKKLAKAELTILTPEERSLVQFIAFGPVIEPYVSDMTFLPAHPRELAKDAWGNELDVIVGGCSHEGLLFWAGVSEKTFRSDRLFEKIVASSIGVQPHNLDICTDKAKLLRSGYYNNEIPSMSNRSTYIDILTDKMFLHGNRLTLMSRTGAGRSWLFRFAAEPAIGVVRLIFGISHKHGAAHGEDVLFIFKPRLVKGYKPGSPQHRLMTQFVGAFAAFARNGDPNCKKLSVNWSPLVGKTLMEWKCLNFVTDEVKVIPLPEADRLKLWDTICSDQITSRL